MIDPTVKIGIERAVRLYRDGITFEGITNRPDYDASAAGRGMALVVEAGLGWRDIAEREARAWGASREEARTLVEDLLRRLW